MLVLRFVMFTWVEAVVCARGRLEEGTTPWISSAPYLTQSTRASQSENHSQNRRMRGVFGRQHTAFLTGILAAHTSGAALTHWIYAIWEGGEGADQTTQLRFTVAAGA